MLDYNEFYLYLIRHGQSEVNALRDIVGQTGVSLLTEKGRHQAQLLGERLAYKDKVSFDKVYSSDYTRAHDTAKIATGNNQPIVLVPEVREYSAGDWTGTVRNETYNVPTLLRMAAMTSAFLPPNGESMHMVERRASKWLEDTVLYNKLVQEEASRRNAQKLPPQNIFVFSHGMTIKCLLHYIMGFDQSFTWKLTLENTSISKLYFSQEGWRLLTINDHAHLL
jgi:broad specificity phosphatase PhoE